MQTPRKTMASIVAIAAVSIGVVVAPAAHAGTTPAPISAIDIESGPAGQTLHIDWAAPDDGGDPITGYLVTDASNDQLLVDIKNPNLTEYAWSGLTPATRYTVGVKAYNMNGPSPLITTANASTAGPASAPQNLTATPSSDGSAINLRWDPPATDGGSPLTGYSFYLDGTDMGDGNASFNSYTIDTGVNPGSTYEVGVMADNTVSMTNPAFKAGYAATSVSTPAVPMPVTGLRAVPADTTIALSWDASANADGYGVSVDGANFVVSRTSFKVTGLLPGQSYEITVVSRNDTGSGGGQTINVSTTSPGPNPGPKPGPKPDPNTTDDDRPTGGNGGGPVTYLDDDKNDGRQASEVVDSATVIYVRNSKGKFLPTRSTAAKATNIPMGAVFTVIVNKKATKSDVKAGKKFASSLAKLHDGVYRKHQLKDTRLKGAAVRVVAHW